MRGLRKSCNAKLPFLMCERANRANPGDGQTKRREIEKGNRNATSQPTWEAEAGSTFPR